MGYTKLFREIVASTIWREDDKTRLVWITMLALKDERHVVEASVPGLADMAKVGLEECQRALERLKSPDPWSRSQEHGGRRIEECDGGWLILNGEKYRRKMSADRTREYQKLYHRDYRKGIRRGGRKRKGGVFGSPPTAVETAAAEYERNGKHAEAERTYEIERRRQELVGQDGDDAL